MKTTPLNHRLFQIKYIGPSNQRGSRVKINDLRFGKSKTISYDYEFNNTWEIAVNWLKSLGIECEVMGEADSLKSYIIGTRNFETQIA